MGKITVNKTGEVFTSINVSGEEGIGHEIPQSEISKSQGFRCSGLGFFCFLLMIKYSHKSIDHYIKRYVMIKALDASNNKAGTGREGRA